MKAAVLLFPGINREHDMVRAIRRVSGRDPTLVWHTESTLPAGLDLIVIPGGFSYGDYLRAGAIAARSPIMRAVVDAAAKGVRVLGVCNGFQILTESGLLPGALMRNAGLKFVCKTVRLKVENASTFFTNRLNSGDVLPCPVAHHDGNYFADAQTLKRLEGDGRVVFRYADGTNPNGSINDIAGIVNEAGNVIGMMPHPEDRVEALHGGEECKPLFDSLLAEVAA
ncbi:MAG TPA: phosphoribosylformylglycinamidine synthase subunit PurQ [Thermopetrobacter sp.]|nr:phosphoribosylformylglycinamidine synthase subunit PurQ [Thermopetrobacter sp.]